MSNVLNENNSTNKMYVYPTHSNPMSGGKEDDQRPFDGMVQANSFMGYPHGPSASNLAPGFPLGAVGYNEIYGMFNVGGTPQIMSNFGLNSLKNLNPNFVNGAASATGYGFNNEDCSGFATPMDLATSMSPSAIASDNFNTDTNLQHFTLPLVATQSFNGNHAFGNIPSAGLMGSANTQAGYSPETIAANRFGFDQSQLQHPASGAAAGIESNAACDLTTFRANNAFRIAERSPHHQAEFFDSPTPFRPHASSLLRPMSSSRDLANRIDGSDGVVIDQQIKTGACSMASSPVSREPETQHAPLSTSSFNQCDECSLFFPTSRSLVQHGKIKGHKSAKCICDKVFSRKDALDRHVDLLTKKKNADKAHRCSICPRRRETRFHRFEHLVQHLGGYHRHDSKLTQALNDLSPYGYNWDGYLYICPYKECPDHLPQTWFNNIGYQVSYTRGRPFEGSWHFDLHMRFAHNELPFPCPAPDCDRVGSKGFKKALDLTKHAEKVHVLKVHAERPGGFMPWCIERGCGSQLIRMIPGEDDDWYKRKYRCPREVMTVSCFGRRWRHP